MQREASVPEPASRVVIMPNLLFLANSDRSLIFCSSETSLSRLAALYGSAGASPVTVWVKWADDIVDRRLAVRLMRVWDACVCVCV